MAGTVIPQVVTEDRASGAQFIDGSLKFDGSKSTRLEKTFASAGNRQSWTWSCWVKRDTLNLSNRQVIFGGYGANNDADWIEIGFDASGDDVYFTTSAIAGSGTPQRRDPAGWYHFFSTYDGSTLKIYVNNNLDLSHSFSGNRGINNNAAHFIGQTPIDTVDRHLDGKLSQCYFIDGQVLNPSDFAFTDLLTNTWRPKKYDGTFGTNGFWLPMDGNTPIGKDQSGRGNDWTPVNFGGSVALDNPQANGALPILNTDGGGKVATVGVRTDSYASNLALAIPLSSDLNTVTNQINGGASNRTILSHNSPSSSASKSNFYGRSYYLDGSQAITIGALGTDLQFGSDDFTMEMWFNSNTTLDSTYWNPIVSFPWHGNTNENSQLWIGFAGGASSPYSAGELHGRIKTASGIVELPSGILTAYNDNAWHHVAVTRNGSTASIYVDGVLRNTASISGSVNTSYGSYEAYIGAYDHGGGGLNAYFTGYVSDFRVYKGVAKYTSDFVVPSTNPDILPETPSGVSGGSKLTKVTDGAVAFRGTNDRLEVPKSTDFDFPGEFTMEAWVYVNSYSIHNTAIFESIDWNSQLGQYSFGISSDSNDNRVQFYNYNATNTYHKGTSRIGTNRWYHLAVSRDSNSDIRLFVNGVLETTVNNSYSFSNSNQPNPARIGGTKIGNPGSGIQDSLDGFISNVRIIKGTALYTSDFTPPTAPLTNVTNTKLLCCQSNTSATEGAVGSVNNPTGGGYAFTNAKTYSVYNGGARAANYSVQYSDDNVNWTTAWSGNMHNNSSCGLQQGTGSGNPGSHQYWRYVEGSSTVGHHPRISRIVLNDGTTDVNIRVYTSDNCSDSGDYVIGTTSTYTDSSYGPASDAKATKFNPFNTDINAIRGQETGYATLNPLDKNGGSLSDGNLTFTDSGSDGWDNARATIGASKGKFYWEMTVERINQVICASIAGPSGDDASNGARLGYLPGQVDDAGVTYYDDGRLYHADSQSGGQAGWGATYGAGDIISIALDMDDSGGKVWFAKNGIWQASGNPSTGANAARSDLKTYADTYFPISGTYYANTTQTFNFGQKPFKFPPPDGFQPLNLSTVQPEKVFARPDQYVSATLFTGTGDAVSSRTVELPQDADLVWAKSRDRTSSNQIADTVRGNNSVLITNASMRAQNPTTEFNGGGISTIDGKTITIASGTTNNQNLNVNGDRAVIWSWKAGGSEGTFNVDGATYATAAAAGLSAGTMTVTGASVGTKQGFSIVRYTGSGSAGSLAHGLGQKPTFWILKAIDAANYPNWYAYTEQLDGSLDFMHFHTNEHKFDSSAAAPTSTTIGITSTLAQAVSWITYMWHDVPGLQKFGSFIGNSSQNFVELGFRPAIVWVKRAIANSSSDTSTNNSAWTIMDSTRLSYNGQTPNHLYANHTADEGKRGDGSGTSSLADMTLEPHSNGFYLNGPATETNSNTGKFIYCAWAEAPSINLYGAQANAR